MPDPSLTDGCDPATLTASAALTALRGGTLTAEALTRACLARIEARDGDVRAWSFLDPDLAIRQARAVDDGPWRGPLHGLPIGVKDVIDTFDMPTAHNSPLYSGRRPADDAPAVALLRHAGAIVLGKTDTTEFAAAGRNAATRNPWSLDHTPGGSSSGSAAAVAGFQVPLALGTQTGGSTIRPASFCGVFAMKPTWGAVSREGLKLYSITLDTLGWFGRGVADLGLICDALEIDDDEQHAPPSRPRIALCRTPSWPWAAPETAAAMDRAAALLDAAGVELHELTLPDSFDDLVRAHQIIMFLEGRAAFLTLARTHAETLHDDFHLRVDNREGFSRADLRNAYDLAARCRAEFDGIARAYDAVLTPSAPGEAPLGTIPGDPVFNSMWTLLHTPCVNIPAFRSQGGLPVGLTLTGPRFSDRGLLATAQNVSDILLAAGDWRIAPPDQDAELRILTASR